MIILTPFLLLISSVLQTYIVGVDVIPAGSSKISKTWNKNQKKNLMFLIHFLNERKNGHRPRPCNLGRVVKVSNWWTLKWTFILSEENRWCGILMTLAARSRKSVVRLQTCIKCGKSLVEHSMSSLATGITTAKI